MGVVVLWHDGALGSVAVLRRDGSFGLLAIWFRSGMLSFFSVRMCKIFLFGVGGKSIETYLSAIDDLRPGLLLICPNLSGAVRAIITL